MPKKYHVALSFAGEDRAYVGQVADALQAEGVDVFYDKFAEADLWGKDLYVHLSDIYQNRAVYTVIFISDAYGKKLWTNHERKSAQARAFSENQEYILPAFFDEAIEVPGLLKTVGYISLRGRSPAEFAALIVEKLRKGGVRLKQAFAYSAEAKADVDFRSEKVTEYPILLRLCAHIRGPSRIRRLLWCSRSIGAPSRRTKHLYLDGICISAQMAMNAVRTLSWTICELKWPRLARLNGL